MADPTVEDVDAFIAEYKTLDGFFPPWGQRRGLNWESRWGILNSLNARVGELSFSINAYLTKPTICALFRQRLIYRLDVVPMDECKSNDWGAESLGLPSRVCGPHTHAWENHRAWVQSNGFGELPFRNPVDMPDGAFIRVLERAAQDLNIHVEPSQRDIDLPAQPEMFDGKRR